MEEVVFLGVLCKSMAAGRYLAKGNWGFDRPPAPPLDQKPKQPARRKKPTSKSKRK